MKPEPKLKTTRKPDGDCAGCGKPGFEVQLSLFTTILCADCRVEASKEL